MTDHIPDDLADLTYAHVRDEAARAAELRDRDDDLGASQIETRLAWTVLRAIATGHPDAASLARAAL
jgi:hypothetical protein